jgi:hypothetical protein
MGTGWLLQPVLNKRYVCSCWQLLLAIRLMDQEEEADDGLCASSMEGDVAPKAKRWSKSPNEIYFMNILIRTCCQVRESGNTLHTYMIHVEVMDGWHTRCGVLCVVWCVLLRLTFNHFPLTGTWARALLKLT